MCVLSRYLRVCASLLSATAVFLLVSCGGTVSNSGVALVSVSVTPSPAAIPLGGNMHLAASGQYSDGSVKDLTSAVQWRSSNQAVVTVSPGGVATGAIPGTATVSASLGAASGSASVTVSSPSLATVVVSPSSPSIPVGSSVQFSAAGTYSNGSTQDMSSTVQWVSSNSSIVSMSSTGLATALAGGTATISAESGLIAGSTQVTVPNSATATGGCDGAGSCYVRADATGAGTGADWTNAYTGFGPGSGQVAPSSMQRGVIYWVASGNYAGVSFNAPESASALITIKGATDASHGSASDWTNSYGGQAVFSPIAITTSNWVFDGQSRGADWQSAYTMKFWNQSVPGGAAVVLGTYQSGVNNVSLRYIEVEGSGAGFPNNTATTDKCSVDNCGVWDDNGIYEAQPVSNIYVGYSYLHHTGNAQFQFNATSNGGTGINSNLLVEYSWVSYNHTGQNGQHDSAAAFLANNLTVRYNVFQDNSGSGLITDASANHPTMANWYVYGNVFFNDAAYLALGQLYWLNTVDQGVLVLGDGGGADNSETLTGTFQFTNNTMANFNPPGVSCLGTYSMLPIAATTMVSGSASAVIENNLWYRSFCVYGNYNPFCHQVSGACTQDYNASYSGGLNDQLGWQTLATPSAHDVNISGTVSPFVDSTASTIAGFELVAPDPFVSYPGAALGAPFNLDILGVTRGADGTWDRGALQLNGPGASATPASMLPATRRKIIGP